MKKILSITLVSLFLIYSCNKPNGLDYGNTPEKEGATKKRFAAIYRVNGVYFFDGCIRQTYFDKVKEAKTRKSILAYQERWGYPDNNMPVLDSLNRPVMDSSGKPMVHFGYHAISSDSVFVLSWTDIDSAANAIFKADSTAKAKR